MSETDHNAPKTSAMDGNPGNIIALPTKAAPERPSVKVIAFVKKHPGVMVAGGIAAGVAVAALLPRKYTRGVTSKAMGLAQAAGSASFMFGRRAGMKVKELGHTTADSAHLLEDQAVDASKIVAARVERIGVGALALAAAIGRATGKQAARIGEAAHDGSAKIVHVAEDLRHKIVR